MEIKVIRVTDKGQISLPIRMREILGIKYGDNLLVTQDRDSVVIKKVKKENFHDLLKHSEKLAKKFWGNKEDEIWNEI